MTEPLFMGKKYDYWIELQTRVDGVISAERLIKEVMELRAKVSFYESRIEEMNKIREK